MEIMFQTALAFPSPDSYNDDLVEEFTYKQGPQNLRLALKQVGELTLSTARF